MHPSECEFHLGLDARHPNDPVSLRESRQIVQKGCLSDSGFASQDQHATLPCANVVDEALENLSLSITIEQA
jgi:hypothetical protein